MLSIGNFKHEIRRIADDSRKKGNLYETATAFGHYEHLKLQTGYELVSNEQGIVLAENHVEL